MNEKQVCENVEYLINHLFKCDCALQFNKEEYYDINKYVSVKPFQETCRPINYSKGKPISEVCFVMTYDSLTGKITVPRFNALNDEYSRANLVLEEESRKITEFGDCIINAQIMSNINDIIDGKDVSINSSRERLIERLIGVTPKEWETNMFGKQLRAVPAYFDSFGKKPGDEIIDKSVIKYNQAINYVKK